MTISEISTNVSFMFFDLISQEFIRSKIHPSVQAKLWIVSPWMGEVLFPSREFGFSSNVIILDRLLYITEIVKELCSLDNKDVKIVTLSYYSEQTPYKNPMDQDRHPGERTNQIARNVGELRILKELCDHGAEIFLHPNFHDKIVVTSLGAYKGSFNFTITGYYRNMESGTYYPNYPARNLHYLNVVNYVGDAIIKNSMKVDADDIYKMLEDHMKLHQYTQANYPDLCAEWEKRMERKHRE